MTAAAAEKVVFAPQPGPQVALLSCQADIAFIGGSAGGGKSYGLCLDGGRWCTYPKFRGVLLRRTSTDLRKAGGLWDKGSSMFRRMGARSREGSEMDCTWPTGAQIQFRGCEHEKDVEEWQGAELDWVGMDEVTHFTAYQFWYLVSRLRSVWGFRSYIRASCNPDPDSWVKPLLAWWIGEDGFAIPERSGVLRWICRRGDEIRHFDTREECQEYLDSVGDSKARPMSLTFILASLADNPALTSMDPGYEGRLAMQDAVIRARLLDGNWNSKATAGAYFNRMWFEVLDAVPPWEHVHLACRGWDLAASAPTPSYPDPDWTVGVLMYVLTNGRVVVVDVVRVQDSEGAVDLLMAKTAQLDGPRVIQAVFQDLGAAGKRDVAHVERNLRKALPSVQVAIEPATRSKETFARPLSARLDPRTRRNQLVGAIVRAAWNQAYLSELEAFPGKAKDDQVDASSVAFAQIDSEAAPFAVDFVRTYGQIRV